MKTITKFFFLFLLIISGGVSAQEDSYIHAKGHACEEIKNSNKSAARTQAADKASFDAITGLDIIKEHKNNFNEHDFNVLIYSLIDSVLEGVAVQTTNENDSRICVEVNAMIQEQKMRTELAAALKERGEKAPTDVVVEVVEDKIAAEQNSEQKSFETPKPAIEDRALVFVAPTVFYNGATSDNHSKLLRHYLSNNDNFYITDSEEIADFTIHPRVEKARIDENKAGIKRLQIQTAFTLISSDGEEIIKDEQTRAIICDENKSEQQNAQDLIKKMFAKSAKRIAVEIEKFEKAKAISGL